MDSTFQSGNIRTELGSGETDEAQRGKKTLKDGITKPKRNPQNDVAWQRHTG